MQINFLISKYIFFTFVTLFPGEKAYKNWLTSKGLKTEPTKAELSEKEKQAQARKAAAKAMAKKEKVCLL